VADMGEIAKIPEDRNAALLRLFENGRDFSRRKIPSLSYVSL